MKLDKFKLEIKIHIFNHNRVKQLLKGCNRTLKAEPIKGTAAVPAVGITGGMRGGLERAAGLQEALLEQERVGLGRTP